MARELEGGTSGNDAGDGIPAFSAVHGEIWPRVTRPQVVVLFGFFVAFCVVVLVKIVLFEYFPSVLESICPMLTRLTQKSGAAKGIPNYFDAIPTPLLRDKIVDPRVSATVREKCLVALDKRTTRQRELGSSSPRRRNRRSVSAAEQYSDARWIVGCASYGAFRSVASTRHIHCRPSSSSGRSRMSLVVAGHAAISDNKEYVDQLAIDSQLSEGISIEDILCKDVESDPPPFGSSETYLVSQLSVF